MNRPQKMIMLSRKRTGIIEKIIPSKDDEVNICGQAHDFPRGTTRSKKEFKRAPKRHLEPTPDSSSKRRKVDSMISIKRQNDFDIGEEKHIEIVDTLKLVTKLRQFKAIDSPEKLMDLDDMDPVNLPFMESPRDNSAKLNLKWDISRSTQLSLSFDPWNIFGDLDDFFPDDFQ
uniref:Uncharacterized protein n=1 Tax=viral metagenome TaxID=1070528 RepID=A0A6C0C6G2_9ZZZZ